MFRLDFKVISKDQSQIWWHSMHLQKFWPCAHLLVPIVIRWSLAFIGCFNPEPWHPPVGGSEFMANPLLDGLWLQAQIISRVPYPAGWPLCCLSWSSYCCLAWHALPHIPSLGSSFHTDSTANDLYRKQPSAPSSILAVCYKVCILKAFSHNFLSMALSASLIVGTLTLCLVKG